MRLLVVKHFFPFFFFIPTMHNERGKKRGRKKRRRALYNSFSCSLTQLSRRRLYVRIDSLSLFKTTLFLFSRAIFLEADKNTPRIWMNRHENHAYSFIRFGNDAFDFLLQLKLVSTR